MTDAERKARYEARRAKQPQATCEPPSEWLHELDRGFPGRRSAYLPRFSVVKQAEQREGAIGDAPPARHAARGEAEA